MSFRRQTVPPEAEEPSNLPADLAAIGMVLGVAPSRREPNIEDTLIRGSVDALERDFRLLAPLVLWFRVHHLWVNAGRLTRLVRDLASPRGRAFWAGAARWKHTDHRFERMMQLHRGQRIIIPGDGPEDPRFRRGPIRIPASATRERAADVLSPAMLARRHAAYRWRLIIGLRIAPTCGRPWKRSRRSRRPSSRAEPTARSPRRGTSNAITSSHALDIRADRIET